MAAAVAMTGVAISGYLVTEHWWRAGPGAGLAAGAPVVRAPAVRAPGSMVYTTPSGILFDVDSATLTGQAVILLQALAAQLQKAQPTGTIRVEGYADDVGTERYNNELSAARAQTVADWLVREADLESARLEVYAYGETSPAEPNDSEAHRQANRRVVIVVEP